LLLLLPLHRSGNTPDTLSPLLLLPGPPALGGWTFWDKVVQQPDGLEHSQLETAAKALKLSMVRSMDTINGWKQMSCALSCVVGVHSIT